MAIAVRRILEAGEACCAVCARAAALGARPPLGLLLRSLGGWCKLMCWQHAWRTAIRAVAHKEPLQLLPRMRFESLGPATARGLACLSAWRLPTDWMM